MSASLHRWLVVWMLLVAVPLQGIAAVVTCGPVHQRVVERAVQSIDAGRVSHAHHAGAAADAFSQASSLVCDHARASAGDPVAADGSSDGSSSCNGCAPCCTGAALTSGFALSLPPGPGMADFPSLNDGHPSAPLRALERPPRLHA